MTTAELRATVRRRGDVAIIDLEGDIDREADTPLRDAYDQAVAEGGSGVLLNFERVGYINSTGIAVIVGVLARARRDKRSITAYGLTDHYRQIFSITRLSDFIDIHPDEDTAVGGSPGRDGNEAAAHGGST